MKELKDIVLKKGDIVYFNDNSQTRILLECQINDIEKPNIIKIERPVKYETIYEVPKQILTLEEKEYLEAVTRPFKDKVTSTQKKINISFPDLEYIKIWLSSPTGFIDYAELPLFEKGKYYKGMEPGKEYTLKELGLFEELGVEIGDKQPVLDLQKENKELKQTINTLHQNIRNGSIKDIEEMNKLKKENIIKDILMLDM